MPGIALDHLPIWTMAIDPLVATVTVKLGFQVLPGAEFPDGIANRIIQFPDETFLELLYFTHPPEQLEGEALDNYRATRQRAGANSVALVTADDRAVRRHLVDRGYVLEPEVRQLYDADGAGPSPAASEHWRAVSLKSPPLRASDLFFVHYLLPPFTAEQKAQLMPFMIHPNGAQRLSAVWLLAEDADVERREFERIGLESTITPIRIDRIGARGYAADIGGDRILLLQPDGPGIATDALRDHGPHVLGVSVETSSLDRAQQLIQRAYGVTIDRYPGPAGDSFIAPTREELGLVIEFHAAPVPAN